jgi:hypothetical protein
MLLAYLTGLAVGFVCGIIATLVISALVSEER